MKKIVDFRNEQYDLLLEENKEEITKLTQLVRMGLIDSKKLPLLKKALEKDNIKLSLAEKKTLLELLDSLMLQVLGDNSVFNKVKTNLQKEAIGENKIDNSWPSDKKIPVIIVLKRKAIRVYPDNQKVALYYAPAIDKYVSIPFENINTGISLQENNINIKENAYPNYVAKNINKKIYENSLLITKAYEDNKLDEIAPALIGIAAAASKYGPKILGALKGLRKTKAGKALSKVVGLGRAAASNLANNSTGSAETKAINSREYEFSRGGRFNTQIIEPDREGQNKQVNRLYAKQYLTSPQMRASSSITASPSIYEEKETKQ